MHEKRHFLSYWKHRHDAQIIWPYAYYVTLGSHCKMANLSSEDETDTLPERPTRIQPYQFVPVRKDSERVPEHRVSFEANPMRYSMGFVKLHSLKCSLHKWVWCSTARKSSHLNCINLIHFCLTAGRLRGSSCIVIPGVVCELLQFAATQYARIVNFFVIHMHAQFTEESKMATALTPQTDVTSGKVTWLTENPRLVD